MSSFNFLIPWIENLTTLERLKYTRVFRSWLATTNPPTSGKSERTEPDSNEGWGAFLCAVDSTHCAAIWKTLRKDVCGPCAFFDGSWNKAVFYLVSFQGCIRSVFWGGLAPTTARLAEKKSWRSGIKQFQVMSESAGQASCGMLQHDFLLGAGGRSKKKKYFTSNNSHWWWWWWWCYVVEDEGKRGGGKKATREKNYDDKKMQNDGVAWCCYQDRHADHNDPDISWRPKTTTHVLNMMARGPGQTKTSDEKERCWTTRWWWWWYRCWR